MNINFSFFFQWFKHILFLLGLYCICRILFIYYNATELELGSISVIFQTLFSGIRFDLSAILATNALFTLGFFLPRYFHNLTWYRHGLKILFLSVNGVFILLNFVDTAYYPFIQKRIQSDALLFLTGDKGTETFGLLPVFITQFWHLWFWFFIVAILLVIGYNKLTGKNHPESEKPSTIFSGMMIGVLVIAFNVIGLRGGLQLRPINIINAAESVGVGNASIVLNAPFSILWTAQKKSVSSPTAAAYQKLNSCDQGIHAVTVASDSIKPLKNVVIIMVESLSRQYISAYGGTGKTPFIDSLISVSLTYTNGFANAKESVQGIPAVLSSIPSWMDEPFIFSGFASNKIESLASVLKPYGYHSSFFHGAAKGTMGFHSFTRLAGFDEYYSMESYNNMEDYDGSWGIWDEPYLKFMGKKLTETREPFLAAVLTLNTHHPFRLPKQYQSGFKTAGHPVLSSLRYADYALQQFFKEISNEPWFKNTLFVITADHTGPNTDVLKTRIDEYRIPIIFYDPASVIPERSHIVASQIDIFPSVVHYLGLPATFFSLGNNLFNQECDRVAVNYNMGIYQAIDSLYCLQYNGYECIGMYNWKDDKLLRSNLMDNPQLKQKKENLLRSLRDKIQCYRYILQNNKMTVRTTHASR